MGSIPISTKAQSNNNLEWGVDVGDEFTYVVQRAFYIDPSYGDTVMYGLGAYFRDLDVGQKAILRVDSLEEIPAQINESDSIPMAYCTLTRANDSTVLESNVSSFIFPIGDWDFLTEMTNITGQEGVTLINTTTEWGIKTATSFVGEGNDVINVKTEIRFEKENGTLNYARMQYTTQNLDLIDIILVNWHPGMPTIYSAGVRMDIVIVVVTGVLLGVVVAVFVYLRIKKRKPIVQQLGE